MVGRFAGAMLMRQVAPAAFLAAVATAIRLGIAVPDRLAVAGFDDAPTSRAAWPQITTIRQPKGEMAASAVDILVDPKYRERPTDRAFRRRLTYELVPRLSTDRGQPS